MGFGHVTGPDGCCQTVIGAVGTLDDLVGILEREDTEDRAEDFVAGDRHIVGDIAKNGRFDEEAFLAKSTTTGQTLGPFGLSFVDVAHNLRKLIVVDLRPLRRLGVEGVTQVACLGSGDHFFDEFFVDRLFDKQSRASTTALPLVEEEAKLGTGHRRVEIRIGKNHVGAFAP